MDFKSFLTEGNIKEYNGIFVGRLQPPTIGHANVINTMIKKRFKTINIALSKNHGDPLNPLTITERKMVLNSVWKNIKVLGVETNIVFGMYLPENDEILRNKFKIKNNNPLVIVLGKDDDRFGITSKRSQFFNVNKNEDPSLLSPSGVFGVKVKKISAKNDFRISATMVREAIRNGDVETALKLMIGSDKIKEKIIKKLGKE